MKRIPRPWLLAFVGIAAAACSTPYRATSTRSNVGPTTASSLTLSASSEATTSTSLTATTASTDPPATAAPDPPPSPAPAPTAAPVTKAAPPPSSRTVVEQHASVGGMSAFQACVALRESGNNPHVGSGGLYGILPSTWHSLGYSGTAGQADVATQTAAFNQLYAKYGKSPWSRYDGCT